MSVIYLPGVGNAYRVKPASRYYDRDHTVDRLSYYGFDTISSDIEYLNLLIDV